MPGRILRVDLPTMNSLPRLVVTGASGFIGRHLLAGLKESFKITAMARRSQSRSRHSRAREHLLDPGGYPSSGPRARRHSTASGRRAAPTSSSTSPRTTISPARTTTTTNERTSTGCTMCSTNVRRLTSGGSSSRLRSRRATTLPQARSSTSQTHRTASTSTLAARQSGRRCLPSSTARSHPASPASPPFFPTGASTHRCTSSSKLGCPGRGIGRSSGAGETPPSPTSTFATWYRSSARCWPAPMTSSSGRSCLPAPTPP